jgi:hypothetical protein
MFDLSTFLTHCQKFVPIPVNKPPCKRAEKVQFSANPAADDSVDCQIHFLSLGLTQLKYNLLFLLTAIF